MLWISQVTKIGFKASHIWPGINFCFLGAEYRHDEYFNVHTNAKPAQSHIARHLWATYRPQIGRATGPRKYRVDSLSFLMQSSRDLRFWYSEQLKIERNTVISSLPYLYSITKASAALVLGLPLCHVVAHNMDMPKFYYFDAMRGRSLPASKVLWPLGYSLLQKIDMQCLLFRQQWVSLIYILWWKSIRIWT